MKKIIIISYFYPPCNLTAAQRVHAFAKYLPKSGIYPTVITRNWDAPVRNQYDLSQPSGTAVKHKRFADHEVYYMPYEGSVRDKFIEKFGKNRFATFRRILTFFELLGENYERFPASWNLLYKKARELMASGAYEYLLISANPFWQFYFGYLLKKEFPHIKWVADYRDDWTTGELGKKYDYGSRFIHKLSVKNEKKWLSNVDLITSVSSILSQRIGDNLCKPSKTIANGFFLESIPAKKQVNDPKEFIISYTGYLYPQQKIDWFIHALIKIIIKYKDKVYIKIQFIGLAYEEAAEQRILNLMKGFEQHLIITERLSREDSISMESSSDLLLMVAYKDLKGIPGSKLYQYISHQKPVFLCPSDNDIVESILEETGLGIISRTEEKAVILLDQLITKHIEGKPLLESLNKDRFMKYSREQQVEKLANTLKQL